MATLPSLRPNAPVTNANITVVGTTVGWEAIDDDPDSPNTSDYVYDAGTSNGDLIVGLTDMPLGFSTMESPLTVRAVTQSVGFTDDSDTLTVELTDSSGTSWSNTVTLSTQAHTTQALRTASLTLNATALAANKTAWDNARLRMLWTYTASMSKDNGVIRIYALEIDGTYVQAAAQNVGAPNLLAAPATVYECEVLLGQKIGAPALLTNPSTVFTPADVLRGAVALVPPLLAAPATLHLATVTPGPAPPGVGVLLAAPAAVRTPGAQAYNIVVAPHVADTAVVHEPPIMWLGVDVTVEVPHLYV